MIITVGDIFYSSWGYEQTNIDFYQVVGVTDKTVKLRKISQENDWSEDRNNGGKTIPKANEFTGEAFSRKRRDGHEFLKISDYCYAYPWDGKPQSFTSYA